jgi:uncharacterized integral membrane protein
MLVVRFLLILAIVILFVSFAANNMEMVELTISPGSSALPLPLYSVIFLALFLGALVAYFLGLVDRFAIARKLKEKDKEIGKLREELYALRNLPIVEEYGVGEKVAPEDRAGMAR